LAVLSEVSAPSLFAAEARAPLPPSNCLSRASTLALPSKPMVVSACSRVSSDRASTLVANAAFAARTLLIFPLFFGAAWPMREAWYMSPYLGVLCFVLRARNRAFSAPSICTVEAGCFARFIRDPAWDMRRAPTSSPTSIVRLGAMAFIRFLRYSKS